MKKIKRSDCEHMIYNVFKTFYPYENCFQSDLNKTFVLFPTMGYYLDEVSYLKLMSIMKVFGQTHFYVTLLDYTKGLNYMITINDDYSEYLKCPCYYENIIYSADGNWGIIFSDELHVLIGCTNELFDYFSSSFNLELNHKRFIEYWDDCAERYRLHINWLSNFIMMNSVYEKIENYNLFERLSNELIKQNNKKMLSLSFKLIIKEIAYTDTYEIYVTNLINSKDLIKRRCNLNITELSFKECCYLLMHYAVVPEEELDFYHNYLEDMLYNACLRLPRKNSGELYDDKDIEIIIMDTEERF